MSEVLQEREDRFVVDTDEKAKMICEKIRNRRGDRDFWVSWYEQKIKEVKESCDFDCLAWEQMLREYFDTVPHKKAKCSESYPLPGGKLVLKKQQPEFKRDDATVIEWLKANNQAQFVKVKEELNWADLKAATEVAGGKVIAGETVNDDGEVVQIVIPGIEVIEREPKFTIEV